MLKALLDVNTGHDIDSIKHIDKIFYLHPKEFARLWLRLNTILDAILFHSKLNSSTFETARITDLRTSTSSASSSLNSGNPAPGFHETVGAGALD